MTVGVVVPAAGRGARFGSPENKIWAHLGERTILDWTLRAFEEHPAISDVVVVAGADELARVREAANGFAKVVAVVVGGASRAESVGNGLCELPARCGVVLVHDAARPSVSPELISRIIEATERWGAAVPGMPVSDTIKRADNDGAVTETVIRAGLWAVQTPQGARTANLREAYALLGNRVAQATDEAAVLESAGFAVYVVEGEATNRKITRPEDVEAAEREMGLRDRAGEVRTGIGYDVHPYVAGRALWLGGVEVPHDRGLAGHSDADVLLHAVCDALLGAAGMGDIGVLFPDTDAAHKDRPSIEFVQEVGRRLMQERWRVVNIDVTLLAEAPRIGRYRAAMVAAISRALGLEAGRVNIKATTSERMGFVGRGEGAACWAACSITR
jgi:2-C-methyl-D-erythritol 4-phosphate cytidylyltransferase / 2-C-methyl-D-erythritol 2,4-cyclodiphosphate synthase